MAEDTHCAAFEFVYGTLQGLHALCADVPRGDGRVHGVSARQIRRRGGALLRDLRPGRNPHVITAHCDSALVPFCTMRPRTIFTGRVRCRAEAK